jgi:superfamily II DNA helicase RecQ
MCYDYLGECATPHHLVTPLLQDMTDHAVKLMECVNDLEGQNKKVTTNQLVEVYRGATTQKIKQCGLQSASHYGGGKKFKKDEVTRIFI